MRKFLKFRVMLYDSLKDTDRGLYDLIEKEKARQGYGLELIASENFTSRAVLDCLGSVLTNKYSEGLPYKRYYGGTEVIDEIEVLCQKRALAAFGLDEDIWGVNVQPYSGSPANLAVYVGLLNPSDKIMGLHLPDGGHLTHGFKLKDKPISATSVFWNSKPYYIDQATGLIDYDSLAESVLEFQPKLIIAGFSCYPRHLDFEKFRKIADSVGAILMADISHVSGLVVSGLSPSPFPFCHVVTTTTHKTLRGPRAGVIFARKDGDPIHQNIFNRINSGVFPSLQGGPHNNVIAAIATTFKQASQPEFKIYAEKILKNCKGMEERLKFYGFKLSSGGSDNHLILVDTRSFGIDGALAERILEKIGISTNKNAYPGDTNMFRPSGLRLGTPALTSRGFEEIHIKRVVDIIHTCLKKGVEIIKNLEKVPTVTEFENILKSEPHKEVIYRMKVEVEDFSSKFPLPGFNELKN